MGSNPHIVIIGAGLIGLSTADSLAARGLCVTIIDRRKGPGQGASFNNSGMIHPSQAAPWLKGNYTAETAAVFALAQRSKKLIEIRAAALGLPMTGRAPGCRQIFDYDALGQQAFERYKDLGVVCENITGAPHTFGRYALQFLEDGAGDAYAYCRALSKNLIERGVVITFGTEDIPSADHIVIAAGASSRAVAASYGIDLPLRSVRGHALNFTRPDIKLPDVPIMHAPSRSALTVFQDHVRLSGTVGENSPLSLMSIWKAIAPEMVGALRQPTLTWSEDRPVSELGRPIITELKPDLWINSGHGHMGWTLSAGSGELMARMIIEGYRDESFGLIA